MLIFGSRLFGKVEQVPGLFHVATQFSHVNFIPLIPTKSWLVLHGSEKSGLARTSWRGIELESIRWGSVGVAWLRFGLFIALFVSGIASLAALGHGGDHASAPWMLLLTAACVVAIVVSYRIVHATGDSLRKLGTDPKVPAELVRQAEAVLQGRKGADGLVR